MDLNFEVIKQSDIPIYANGNDIRMNNLGPVALFSKFKLTTSSGKHLEDISHAQKVSLMYKLVTSSKDSDDLFLGFDRSRSRRRKKLTQKNIKSKHHLRFLLRDLFEYAEHQEKATYGLGHEITLTWDKNDSVIDKVAGLADARIKIHFIHWLVCCPVYTIHSTTRYFI